MKKEFLLLNDGEVENLCEDCILEFAIDFSENLPWESGICDCCNQTTLTTNKKNIEK